MFSIIYFVFSLATAAAGETSELSVPCFTYLTHVLLPDYLDAIAPHELTPERLRRAERTMHVELENLSVWQILPAATRTEMLATSRQMMAFAIQAHLRGWPRVVDRIVDALRPRLGGFGRLPAVRQRLKQGLIEIAERRDIEDPFAMAEFILRRKPSVEAVQFLLMESLGYNFEFIFGPRQAALVRAILQFTLTRPRDRLLEVGFGSPTVMPTLAHYLPHVRMDGLDSAPVSRSFANWAQTHRLNLVRGDVTNEADLNRLAADGKFQVVAAQDTLIDYVLPEADGDQLVRGLAAVIAPSGYLIVLNDYGAPPKFTAAQARAAGFEIVRWGAPRDLPLSVKRISYRPGTVNPGQLRAYVLRLGPEDPARLPVPNDLKPR